MTYDMRVLEKLRRKHNEQVQKEIGEMKETKLAIIYAAREYSPATTTNNIVKNFQPVLDGDIAKTIDTIYRNYEIIPESVCLVHVVPDRGSLEGIMLNRVAHHEQRKWIGADHSPKFSLKDIYRETLGDWYVHR